MKELKIKIKSLEDYIQLLLNKVDSYSMYGRTPNSVDRMNQLQLLKEYKEILGKKLMLEDMLEECVKNGL